VSNEDWYRNQKWNEEIESKFFEKLKRARRKEQYLRIQACTIAKQEPDVALSLLDQYFNLEDDFDHAQAYCDMATAYIKKGEIEKAINSYSKALERESEFPKLQTEAYILYPLIIVQHKINNLYRSANKVLDQYQERLMFPIDHFRWHAAKAILAKEIGKNVIASEHASLAFKSAKIKKSGFKYHQNVGLVGKKYRELINELRTIHA